MRTVPGFKAEVSAYRPGGPFLATGRPTEGGDHAITIVPAQGDCFNTGYAYCDSVHQYWCVRFCWVGYWARADYVCGSC